ncbi:MAG: ChaN family lipoprotein [Bacteroidota bacterium]
MFQKLIGVLFLFLFSNLLVMAQKNPAYQLFNAKGKRVKYKKMVKQVGKADIILFGELHNDPIAHWLQFELAEDLKKNKPLILGLEMLERDNQLAITQYVTDEIDRKQLEERARLWPNFPTDYEPLVNWAKENYTRVIATNIPRRYASMVFKEGFEALESLPEKEKNWIVPLPVAFDIELPGYKNMLTMMGGDEHSGLNFPKAQAIKDATMAHSILEYYQVDHYFLHLNGSYHSDNYEGILWYLQRQNPDLAYATLTTVTQKDIGQLEAENKGKADFIICVPENMTKTY